MNKTKVINRIREFNRFYTVWQGFLNKHFMNSEYSITETRVLFELKNNQPCSAKLISEKLNIDKSYLSRIINVFLSKQLITKEILPKDKRAFMIRLTENGLRIVDELIEKANYQIGCQIQNLSLNQCQEICTSLDIITKYFSDNGKESGSMEIIKYNPKYKNEFIQFNTDWIVENFGSLEKEDIDTFNNLEKHLADGAMVYFAVENNTVLATCMTMKTETNTWEICKLASNKNVNHKGAGSAVVKAGTEYAIKQGAKKLIIVSNTILKPALHIYKNSDLKKYPWMKHIIINALIFSLNTL